MSKLIIVKDTRERKGWYFDETDKCGGTVVKKLNTGDYSVVGCEDIFTVERKGNVSEFATNLIDERFHRELKRLSQFQHPFILLEFYLFNLTEFPVGSNVPRSRVNKIKLTGKYLLKLLTQLHLDYPNIGVLFCGDKNTAQTYFYSLAKRMYGKYCSSNTA